MNRTHLTPSKLTMRHLTVVLSLALGLFAATAAALNEGQSAPEIGKRDLDGRELTLANLRGKVVIVDFWASWCEPCRDEMPVLERLHQRYRDQGLVVIGISVDRSINNVRGFLRRTPVSFSIVHDADHDVANRYRPPRMPSSYIIDREGIVRHVQAGFSASDASRLEREVRSLL